METTKSKYQFFVEEIERYAGNAATRDELLVIFGKAFMNGKINLDELNVLLIKLNLATKAGN